MTRGGGGCRQAPSPSARLAGIRRPGTQHLQVAHVDAGAVPEAGHDRLQPPADGRHGPVEQGARPRHAHPLAGDGEHEDGGDERHDRDRADRDGQPGGLGEQADRGRAAEQAGVADRGGQRDARARRRAARRGRSPAGRRWPAPGRRARTRPARPRGTTSSPPRRHPRRPAAAPPTSSRRSPIACSSRPPASRPQAMAREKPAYPAAATVAGAARCSRSSSAPQSVSAPSPNAVQPAIAPSTTSTAVGPRRRLRRSPRRRGPRCRGAAPSSGGQRPRADEQAGGRDERQVRAHAEHGGGGAADERAAEPAEAEAGVQPGQDRPADARLHLHADGVGRDVDHAGRGAEDEQRDAQRRDRVDEPGQDGGRRDRDRGDGADRSGAEPGAPGAGEAHADERAERQAEQGDARACCGRRPPGRRRRARGRPSCRRRRRRGRRGR